MIDSGRMKGDEASEALAREFIAAQKKIKQSATRRCPRCKGTGNLASATYTKEICPVCEGLGVLPSQSSNMPRTVW